MFYFFPEDEAFFVFGVLFSTLEMPYVSTYKRKRSSSSSKGSGRKTYAKRKFTRPSRVIRGRGAYYVTGGGSGSGSLGPLKVSGHVNAGYATGGGDKVLGYIAPKVTGVGAYNISSIKRNVLLKPGMPMVANAIYAEGGTIVRHREYLGPVISSATAGEFKQNRLSINPAQSYTFPWLSSIASNYEEYRPNGLYFEYRSTCSDAIASSTDLSLGQVMLCTQYDPTDPPFTGQTDMLNYFWSQNGKVSQDVMHFIECDPAQSPLSHFYTREGSNSTSTDLRFSDIGTFTIATQGLQGASVTVGQLWVSYEFIFYKPKIGRFGSEPGGWTRVSNAEGVAGNTPWGTLTEIQKYPGNNIGCTVDYFLGNRLVFPVMNISSTFMVYCMWVGGPAALPLTAPQWTDADPSVDFVRLNTIEAQLKSPFEANVDDKSSSMGNMCFVSIKGDGLVHWIGLVMANTNMPAGAEMNLYVAQIPYMDPQLYQ